MRDLTQGNFVSAAGAGTLEATTSGGVPELSRTSPPRHVSMIAIGGIIGAGLFVGSSTTISLTGPAAVISYLIAGLLILLVMRMIAEMAIVLEGVQSFPDFARAGVGHLAGFLPGWLYWSSGSWSWRWRRLPGRRSSAAGCLAHRNGPSA